MVNIPVAGDDHQPQLQDFYQAEVLGDGSLSGNTTFTATDEDVLLPNNCSFKLIPDSYGFDLEKLTENSVELKLGDDFDPNSLPSEGKVSFTVEVTAATVSQSLCNLIL